MHLGSQISSKSPTLGVLQNFAPVLYLCDRNSNKHIGQAPRCRQSWTGDAGESSSYTTTQKRETTSLHRRRKLDIHDVLETWKFSARV